MTLKTPIDPAPEELGAMHSTMCAAFDAVIDTFEERYRCHGVATVAMMIDWAILVLAAVDQDAALDYVRAKADVVDLHGQPEAEEAAHRKSEAFNRLAKSVQMQSLGVAGTA